MPLTDVSQDAAPCVLHAVHSPVTIVNELHHPFPQEWQKAIWGRVRDHRVVSLCATGHNSVHAAITHRTRHGVFPAWCVGKTRDLALSAFTLRDAALAGAPVTLRAVVLATPAYADAA